MFYECMSTYPQRRAQMHVERHVYIKKLKNQIKKPTMAQGEQGVPEKENREQGYFSR